MTQYLWSDSYSVKVPNVDAQHKKLFEMIEQLQTAMKNGSGKEELGKMLDFLANYTVQHFKDEEDVMKKLNVAGLEEHKKEHEDFVKFVSDTIQKFKKDGASLSMLITIHQQVGEWLVDHILKKDKQIANYVK
ncbi:MAG TPA: bacteriohemerythrin [Ignavibacteriales bacterium]|nr:bacteriohemerythrin [Ignavibacteriales bacterium]HPD67562.1 bacteriohemerythrin [Ignavibacteriales bacterium]HRR19707.1 bacteriohemerythrin [Ignavibacteriales bacterium]HRT99080.1 bacteriohemerythrin [Ignavibacteriales bacterium]